ncbi:MAG: LysE family translocator [Pseudomonadota bacterium]
MVESFLALGALWLLAAMMPGPNFFAVMHVAAGQGRRGAWACAMGIVVGTTVWALAGFFGLKALFAALPAAAIAIKLAGAAYLIWVGVGLWRAAAAATSARTELQTSKAFLFGLATNLANPKTAAFAASLFAVALPVDASTAVSLMAVLMVCTISTLWYSLVAAVGSTGPFVRAYAGARRPILRITAVIFAGYGASLAHEAATEG